MTKKRSTSKSTPHRFGGDWTRAKLDVLKDYLAAYTKALKDKPTAALPFRKAYIDAFAGTGTRTARERDMGSAAGTLLFPDLKLPESWRQRMDAFLGTTAWYDEFYKVETKPTLFGDHQVQVKASMDVMARYFNDRLKQVFAGVVEEPGVLWNSANNPLYLLCFAVGNERGKVIALRIANHLLKPLKEVR